jgi:hypothetical protein
VQKVEKNFWASWDHHHKASGSAGRYLQEHRLSRPLKNLPHHAFMEIVSPREYFPVKQSLAWHPCFVRPGAKRRTPRQGPAGQNNTLVPHHIDEPEEMPFLQAPQHPLQ